MSLSITLVNHSLTYLDLVNLLPGCNVLANRIFREFQKDTDAQMLNVSHNTQQDSSANVLSFK